MPVPWPVGAPGVVGRVPEVRIEPDQREGERARRGKALDGGEGLAQEPQRQIPHPLRRDRPNTTPPATTTTSTPTSAYLAQGRDGLDDTLTAPPERSPFTDSTPSPGERGRLWLRPHHI